MGTHTEGLLHVLTTTRTFLRRVVRGNGNHLTTSAFSLVLEVLTEHSPGGISNREGQAMVSYHVGWLQIFNGNSLIVFDIVMSGFMQRIFALVRNAFVNTSNKVFGLFASVAALLALSKFALGSRQLL